MWKTFLATLNPMLMLFICITIGFILRKTKILPESAGVAMAKLEIWVFCPALSFYTMSYYCTPSNVGIHATNILLSAIGLVLALLLAILLSRLFVKQNTYERNVYQYSFSFANSGYMGDPLVQSMLGDVGLAYYKLYCLPITMLSYVWGMNVLIPKEQQTGNAIKRLFNAPTVAMFIGIIVGLSGLGKYLLGPMNAPNFFGSTMNILKSCMGPVAMLLVGFTVAKFDVKSLLGDIKIYVMTLFRLVLVPMVLLGAIYGLKQLLNVSFGLEIDNFVLHLSFFAIAAPVGLNTVIFSEAYGGEAKTGASMAMISHTICVITIPLMYALVSAVFPL